MNATMHAMPTGQRMLMSRMRPCMRISASQAYPYHTSTPAFQCCPIQKEAVAFCASAGLPSVHLDYDRTLKALFIHASGSFT